MAKANVTTPFPADVDRDEFGHWLSGFTDGEGSFVLNLYRGRAGHYHAAAYFRIKLRDDDLAILEQVRSFWGCGVISRSDDRRSKVPNAKPNASLTVSRVPDLVSTVIPHFERFRLRAKKRTDFPIWRQGVEVLAAVQVRPVRARRPGAGRPFTGTRPKWTDAERERFGSLSLALREQRRYVDGVAPEIAPRGCEPATQRSLFE